MFIYSNMPSSSRAEYMRNYRNSHPEYYNKENERNKGKLKDKYNTDEAYREKKKKDALEYYYRTRKATDDY